MIKIMDIQSEINLQSQHPHLKVHKEYPDSFHTKNSIERELFFQQNGRYPNTEKERIPEEIVDLAMDIEDYLAK